METSTEAATANGTTNQVRIRTRRALLDSSQVRRRATRWLRDPATRPMEQTGASSTGTRRESLTSAAARSTACDGATWQLCIWIRGCCISGLELSGSVRCTEGAKHGKETEALSQIPRLARLKQWASKITIAEFGMLVLTVVIAISTTCYTKYAKRQWRVMRDQLPELHTSAEAAKSAADID